MLTTLRQELVPDRLQGRIAGVTRLIDQGTAAPGALLGGVVAAQFGVSAPFWLHAGAGMLLLPLVWRSYSERAVSEARQRVSNYSRRRGATT